jgi:hypothetical protein
VPRDRTQVQTQDEPASLDQASPLLACRNSMMTFAHDQSAPYTKLTYNLTYTKLT